MTATKERPILFTGEMIRAILNHQKTQTRRVVRPQPWRDNLPDVRDAWVWSPKKQATGLTYAEMTGLGYHRMAWAGNVRNPHTLAGWAPYAIGDHLWARETIEIGAHMMVVYRADGSPVVRTYNPNPWELHDPDDWPWQRSILPSIFMPRWASRILLEVTGVRVERVQDISEYDAQQEGAQHVTPSAILHKFDPPPLAGYQSGFRDLWDGINTKRGFAWDTNPWVWVVEFRIHDGERPRYD